MNDRVDTIAALATAPGLSGVAVVRLSGPDAAKIVSELTGSPLAEPYRAELRAVRNRANELLDRALVIYFRAPKSYTGEDVVEIQCHGGNITPRRILEACFAAGARLARRGEFTERAFLNGKLDYDQVEAVLDLVHAKTDRAAAAALAGLSGRNQRDLKTLYHLALEISSILEHSLDVSEEELPPMFYQSLETKFTALRSQLESAIRSRKESRLLRNGALVVLAGVPNAGKSSLLNVLLKENRAIVSATPGTTRDSIEAWMELDGFPLRLVDTAGLRTSTDAIESEGVRRSEELISQADIVLYLQPATSNSQPPALSTNPRTLIITSKSDLGRGEGINVSAHTGEGLDQLKAALVARLETLAPPADDTILPVLFEVASILSSSLPKDLILLANTTRALAEKLGSLIGATYSSDLLDQLFSRFCVGK